MSEGVVEVADEYSLTLKSETQAVKRSVGACAYDAL
jgi:hypothetical protein